MTGDNEGWVKLHRKLRHNPIYTNSRAVHCWIECLLRASHTKRACFSKRKRVDLEPGQFLMGRDEFGKSVGMSGSTAWFWILQFEFDSMVDIKKTSKGSIVKVKEWKKYQGLDSNVDSKKTAKKQQKNTNKNVKNEKKNTLSDKSDEEFSSSNWIADLKKDKNTHIRIIGWYFEIRGARFPTKEAAQIELKRWVKDARYLQDYAREEILEAKRLASQKYPEEWNLSTVKKLIAYKK